MATIYSECPSCGAEGKIDDALVGRRIKCNKCGTSFTLEVGGTYDVVAPEPAPAAARDDASAGQSGPGGPRPKPAPAPAALDPDLLKRLESWADE